MAGNKNKPSRPRKMRLVVKFFTIVLLSSLASVSVLGFMSYNQYQEMKEKVEIDRIYKNVYVNDVNIGGLTKDEAFDKLYEEFQSKLDEMEIVLHLDGKQLALSYKEFGAKYDFSDAIDKAYRYAKEGNLKQRYDKVTALEKTPYKITYDLEYTYKKGFIEEMIASFADEIYISPIDATISRVNGEMVFTREKLGWEMDVQATAEVVDEYLANKSEGMIEVIMKKVFPKFTEADLMNATSLIGSFSTNFSPGDNGRNANIANAMDKIHNTMLFPGEVFSTIYAFGEMTYENGYRLAPEIVNGKLVDGYGGGVCQVSSTLYNAVLYAELEVVERRNHSLKVGYLDYAFDAMIAGDYNDFRFKNNTDYPIIIEAYITNGKTATVNIYGHEIHEPSRRLVFTNEFVSKIDPAADVEIADSSLPLGERVVKTAAKPGYRYNLHKTIYDGDVLISKEFVNQSTYRATPAEVLVGTKVPETPESTAVPTAESSYHPYIFNTN